MPSEGQSSRLKTKQGVEVDETSKVTCRGMTRHKTTRWFAAAAASTAFGKVVSVVGFCQARTRCQQGWGGISPAATSDQENPGWLVELSSPGTQHDGCAVLLGKGLGTAPAHAHAQGGHRFQRAADVSAGVKESSRQVEYRADKGGTVHAGVGKLSRRRQTMANVTSSLTRVRAVKPYGRQR